MDVLLQDIRYAARKLLRTPSFTIIAVATLALAIGATTTVFSIVNGVLLKPLPYRDPGSLVAVGSSSKEGKLANLSPPDFVDYRAQAHSFVGMAQIQERNSANLVISGANPVRLNAASVGANFFDLLGAPMELGRGFMKGDDVHGAHHVVVLADKLWRSSFGANPGIVGQTVSLNGDPYTVVGVAPSSVTYPAAPDVWTPFELEAWMIDPSNRGAHFISAVARLRPGVSQEAARREMAAIGARLRAQYPRSNADFGGTAEDLRESLTGGVRVALFTMFGAVAFVLLIACANVANLLLVRAAGRETEMAVRTALGAGRGRIIRQLVTESVLLSLAGAVIGGALAAWAVDAIVAFGPRALPRLDAITVDTRVLVFAALVALATGVVFGLVPAMHAARTELGQMLRDGTRGAGGRRAARRTRGLLVVSEMALAVVLLVGAGLLIRSFANLVRVNPGFQTENILSFNVTAPQTRYPYDRDLRRFATDTRTALSAVPGVQLAAVTFARPLDQSGMRSTFNIDGRPTPAPGNENLADVRQASANFFATMGMHLARGRLFTPAEENFGPPPVLVVTKAFAKKFFPTEDAIGRRLSLGISHDTAQENTKVRTEGRIVGIIDDVRNGALGKDPYPTVYVGWGTLPFNDMTFLVRYRGDTRAVSSAIRDAVHGVDPEMPIYDMRTMDDVVADSVAQPRFYTLLLTAFAALALLLAALGIYGVISYTVSQRTRELGIRIALGASRDRVVRLVLGQGMALTVVGVGAGLVGAGWLVRLLSTLLYGVAATDVTTFAVVAALLVLVSALASYLPARRAANVDPVIAMRAD